VGGAVAGYSLLRRMREIDARGSAIEMGLSQLGAAEARRVAAQAGEQIMGEVYGLTPERIAGASRLAQQLEPITRLF